MGWVEKDVSSVKQAMGPHVGYCGGTYSLVRLEETWSCPPMLGYPALGWAGWQLPVSQFASLCLLLVIGSRKELMLFRGGPCDVVWPAFSWHAHL